MVHDIRTTSGAFSYLVGLSQDPDVFLKNLPNLLYCVSLAKNHWSLKFINKMQPKKVK